MDDKKARKKREMRERLLPCPHCGFKPKAATGSKICGRCSLRVTPLMTAEEAAAYLRRAPSTILHGTAGTDCLRKVRPGRQQSVQGSVFLVYAQVIRHAELEIRDGYCDGSCKEVLVIVALKPQR
jgi:hypothetical protein